MVRFCRFCERACGKDTIDSIDYQTFYVIVEKQPEVVVEIEKQPEVVVGGPVEIHEDVDVLSQLLPKDEDKKGKDKRYLINKTGNQVNNGNVDNVNNNLVLLSKDSVEKKRVVKREKYKEYENAIEKFIPELLEYINHAKTGFIRIKISDITAKMGGTFQKKSLSSIFFGLKYVLYHNGIWIRIGTLNDDSKIFIMRRKNGNDTLPQSLIKRQ